MYSSARLSALTNGHGFWFLVISEIIQGRRGFGRFGLQIRVIKDVV